MQCAQTRDVITPMLDETGKVVKVLDGVTVLTFQKKLNEDQFERPSDQVKIMPNLRLTDMIFAIGANAPGPSSGPIDFAFHGGGYSAASIWIGLAHFTPPPSWPPSPPPSPPRTPPPSLPPLQPMPLPPSLPPPPPPADCQGEAEPSNDLRQSHCVPIGEYGKKLGSLGALDAFKRRHLETPANRDQAFTKKTQSLL